MKPLIDADILLWECGSIGEGKDGEGPSEFSLVSNVLDKRIEEIEQAVGATEPPRLYLTGKGNFREVVAFTKGYKANRKDLVKPYHTANLKAYMNNKYDTVTVEGMEADDQLCIDQALALKEGKRTVICTRDKDLRMMPGMHYGWECGQQREYGPKLVTPDGDLELSANGKKLTGTGMSFFYAQMLMGDTTDNIPGCPGIGPKKAYMILKDVPVSEMFSVVQATYHGKGLGDDVILEQGMLLWMVRELHEDGSPVMWELPDG